jgi:hypothetical protein
MQYKMNGLTEDNTQGWMAAVGVLYILDRKGLDVQLQWDRHHPVIHGVDQEQVIDVLMEYLEQGSDILEYLPIGIGGEKASLDLTAGRVNLNKVIGQMLATVDREKIDEALNQRWKNEDNITSLGWDAGAVKLAANIGGDSAPDASPHRGVLAGQWLAAESLPITGTGSRKRVYGWVTWSVHLDMGGVRAVVQALSADWGGVRYEANIARNGQMGYLEPARTANNHQKLGGSRYSENKLLREK